MEILRTVAELRHWSREARNDGGNTIGLVPTMGALHAGHASLIRAAKASVGFVAVSIFVNPTQFGPNEDYASYPRTFEADCALAKAEGADVIFAPSVEELYPSGAATFVEVEGLSNRLDGASRPGHFRGVATVVAKLLIATEADRAFFGQKDAAQVAVLRSRNLYLSPAERTQALVLSHVIRQAEALAASGERRSSALIASARQTFATEPGVRVDYIEVVNWATVEPVETAVPGTLFAVAAWVGPTRLIDNTVLA
jgi:pantoate--beta-alanine ligase